MNFNNEEYIFVTLSGFSTSPTYRCASATCTVVNNQLVTMNSIMPTRTLQDGGVGFDRSALIQC